MDAKSKANRWFPQFKSSTYSGLLPESIWSSAEIGFKALI
jgi:hypothetical protein